MTVYIDNAEFAIQLQRERNELLAENLKLRKELETLRVQQNKPASDKCVICGGDSKGGTYGDEFPVCFECYTNRPEDINKYIDSQTKGKEHA